MFHFSPANSIEFLSASSQIFGALLGLLGLSFVRVAEAKERNVGNLLNTFVADMSAEFKEIEKATGQDIDLHLESPEALVNMLEQYKPQIKPERYSRLHSQCDSLLVETREMRAIGKKFRLNCWVSASLIFLCILGLLLPSEVFEKDMGFVLGGLLILAGFALWQAVEFFLLIANTKAIFTYGSN